MRAVPNLYPVEPEQPPRPRPRALEPRARLLRHGPGSLAAGELVALLLGRGPAGERAARRLLRRHGLRGLARLSHESWRDLRGVGGLGPAGCLRLRAALELGRRVWGAAEEARTPIGGPADVARAARTLRHARQEHLVGLYLDAQNGLVHRETISIGSLNTTRSHPREILYPAIAHLALAFVLVHNHPSGNLEPSDEDVRFTQAVRRAGELLGIELVDHVIVSRRGWVSLRERGLL